MSWLAAAAKVANLKYNHKCKFTLGWVERMMGRNGIALRVVQNTRTEGLPEAIPKVHFSSFISLLFSLIFVFFYIFLASFFLSFVLLFLFI